MTSAYKQRYSTLAPAQQQAVGAPPGPVLVIAGPGTGKTEVLAMRIAAQMGQGTTPETILCLTYTDEAANAMRGRLVEIAGPAAEEITVCTFHAFCNNIILAHPEYFGKEDLRLITRLEEIELVQSLLQMLPFDNPLRKTTGNIYSDVEGLLKFFADLKKEGIEGGQLVENLDAHAKALPGQERFIYKIGKNKGQPKTKDLDAALAKLRKQRAAALLYESYIREMAVNGWYDYQDMLVWVLRAFKEYPDLKKEYAERYTTVLVDEFQDTNAAQMELLDLLLEGDEHPNIFAVGDDDQSIFEFQGARLENLLHFQVRYGAAIIVLEENFRSHQPLLDVASRTIANNESRLVHSLELAKNMRAARPDLDVLVATTPVVRAYTDPAAEAADIVGQILTLQQSGTALNKIAVLYAQHKQSAPLMQALSVAGIPFVTKRSADVLLQPSVQFLVLLLRWMVAEQAEPDSGAAYLFEWLHHPCLDINATDLAQVALALSPAPKAKRLQWRSVLSNPLYLGSLPLHRPASLLHTGALLESCLRQLQDLSTHDLLQSVVIKTGLEAWLSRQPGSAKEVEAVRYFLEWSGEVGLAPHALLHLTARMTANGVSLQGPSRDDYGVRLFTAHGAKGHEFEQVFLIGCNAKFWEGKRGATHTFRLPAELLSDDNGKEMEIARRLFYVALTRARSGLQVSYTRYGPDGKSLEPSCYIQELGLEHAVPIQEEAFAVRLRTAADPQPPKIVLAAERWIDQRLASLTMSATNLNRFLRCPIAFYYECIVQAPSLPGPALGFGSAVHTALEVYFQEAQTRGGNLPDVGRLIAAFETAMLPLRAGLGQDEYQRQLERGRNALVRYWNERKNTWEKAIAVEYRIPRFWLDGIPVTGFVDKLERMPDGYGVRIIDYKTGKSTGSYVNLSLAPPNDKNPLGGDYWRQMVLYKILLENIPGKAWKVEDTAFDYIEADDTGKLHPLRHVAVGAEDVVLVRRQLAESWSRIQCKDFSTGCGRSNCTWCSLHTRWR